MITHSPNMSVFFSFFSNILKFKFICIASSRMNVEHTHTHCSNIACFAIKIIIIIIIIIIFIMVKFSVSKKRKKTHTISLRKGPVDQLMATTYSHFIAMQCMAIASPVIMKNGVD